MCQVFDKILAAANRQMVHIAHGADLLQNFKECLEDYEQQFNGCTDKLESAAKVLCETFGNKKESSLLSVQDGKSSVKQICRQKLYQSIASLRVEMERAGVFTDFLQEINAIPPVSAKKIAKRATKKSWKKRQPEDKKNQSASHSYSEISAYREGQQKDIVDEWRSENLVYDDDDSAVLSDIQRRGLLDEHLYTKEGLCSYSSFLKNTVAVEGHAVIAIQGKLGVGKSQLLQWLICEKFPLINEESVILFIGQRSSSRRNEGKQLLRNLLKQVYTVGKKLKGKVFIIIDEPDADVLKWKEKDWKNLHSAAKKYQAKIFLLIRDGAKDKELLKYFPGYSSIQLQEAPEPVSMPCGWEHWINTENVPITVINDLRRLPLFRLAIDNRLWCLENQTLSSDEAMKWPFRNAYALIDHLYVTRLRNKEIGTGANVHLHERDEKESFYQSCDGLFQHVALKLYENGGPVSWDEGVPDIPNRDLLLSDGFVKNVLRIDFRDGQLGESIIHGFEYEPFYNYFLVRAIRERLVSGQEIEQVLPLLMRQLSGESKSIFASGLCELSNDKKRRAVRNLEQIQKEEKRMHKKKSAIVSALIELLSP